jgi:hypothetical protein
MSDVLLEPNVHHVLWDEFLKSPRLIVAGEECARAAMPQIKALLGRPVGASDPVAINSRGSR